MPMPKKKKKKKKKEDKKADGFQISHHYRSFSNDIMAVKGLIYISITKLLQLYNQLFSPVFANVCQ